MSFPGLDSLPTTLSQRILRRNEFALSNVDDAANDESFVLYLPTVVLRKRHNPAFALACHLANLHKVPLIVLAVVLDDAHLPSSSSNEEVEPTTKPIVFTARRIAFVLEALQEATQEWEAHGAGVAIRVHGPKCRTPHHLTLARKALAVVTDEPFVNPYRTFVDSVAKAVQCAKVPLFSVDGSTTVPPVYKLQKKTRDALGNLVYTDVPDKAWQWEARTKANRKGQVMGAIEGHLDAPPLVKKLSSDFFLESSSSSCSILQGILPSDWKSADTPSPGKRPWTVSELGAISNLKEWIQQWPGIDTSVAPCQQTHGSIKAGVERWEHFRDNHLEDYAKLRNNITRPHAVSRMSCYLNYGIVSIFDIVHDTWTTKKGKTYKGAAKFDDEVVKWREIGYVHAFASPYYNLPAAVPSWASRWMATERDNSNNASSYSLEALENGTTRDEKWNAMQRYLVETGELHNNARMTWGKTMLHWQKHDYDVAEVLHQMVYVNDRYALDGLSPPSYAGLLWCFGWCDKPSNKSGAISQKPASRYRASSTGFVQAKESLLAGIGDAHVVTTQSATSRKQKHTDSSDEGRGNQNLASPTKKRKSSPPTKKQQRSIDSYFKVLG